MLTPHKQHREAEEKVHPSDSSGGGNQTILCYTNHLLSFLNIQEQRFSLSPGTRRDEGGEDVPVVSAQSIRDGKQ